MKSSLRDFDEIWCADFEFRGLPGEMPAPVCVVAKEINSGKLVRLWLGRDPPNKPPYNLGSNSLFIAYYSVAELTCHLALGWELPVHNLDLFVEFRNHTNGRTLRHGNSLLGALLYHELPGITVLEKNTMRELIMRGGPWSAEEQLAILNYCQTDVDALEELLKAMTPTVDLPRALLRGRYMSAVAKMEYNGVPVDTGTLGKLKQNWDTLKSRLISNMDPAGIYDGPTFKQNRFESWLTSEGIPWPRLSTGKLDLKDETFKDLSRAYTQVQPIRDLRYALGQLKLNSIAVGSDDRNRVMLSPFRSRTGRNQPSNSKFIFGTASWLRSLIKPTEGMALAYIDWSQQEFGIAAALSRDERMMEAYRSGDPYLAFAKQAGAVPLGATKETHKAERDLFKACVLAVQYGMGKESLALRINQPVAKARELLHLHRTTYRTFWQWSDATLDYAMLHGSLWTLYGWSLSVGPGANPRMLRNFPMQANGAEMLRLACCLAADAGVRVCAPIHDAILIEAPLSLIDDVVTETQALMREASRIVLAGFELGSDAEIIRWPERYSDARGETMWQLVTQLLDEIEVERSGNQGAQAHALC